MVHDLETEEQHDLFPGNSILGVLSCRLLLSLKKEITAGGRGVVEGGRERAHRTDYLIGGCCCLVFSH